MRKIICLTLFLIMINTSAAVNATAADDCAGTTEYLVETVSDPTISSIGGEWTIIGLSRSDIDIDDEYFRRYYANVKDCVKQKDGVLHARKYTEYSRVVTALTAIGEDPENVAGYNLVAPICDYEKTIWQGVNGAIWALIALDSGDYGTSEIRGKYIAYILDSQKEDGGWALSEKQDNSDVDITAMALISLSKYRDRADVNHAVERAISVLSDMQKEKGGYWAYNTQASESTAQVLTAISSLGISYRDKRFIKNGNSLVDNIYSFKKSDGSFSHSSESNLMATEQCFYALVAAERFERGKTSLFDMSDVVKKERDKYTFSGKNADVNVPQIKYRGMDFADVKNHGNQNAIEALAERGIINGMRENVFMPDGIMTRAEFATIIVRALGLSIKDAVGFEDVTASDWYSQYVNTAYSYGIINGVSKTKFDPNGTINFEQACAMVERATKLCGMENNISVTGIRDILAEFTDYITVSEWAKTSVAFCFAKNIADSNVIEIKPHNAVKRCEIAQMIYNMLEVAGLI